MQEFGTFGYKGTRDSLGLISHIVDVPTLFSLLRNSGEISMDSPGGWYGARLVERQIRAEGRVRSAAAGSPEANRIVVSWISIRKPRRCLSGSALRQSSMLPRRLITDCAQNTDK